VGLPGPSAMVRPWEARMRSSDATSMAAVRDRGRNGCDGGAIFRP
jgi:hypothetical protein